MKPYTISSLLPTHLCGVAELERLVVALNENGVDTVRIDFSVINDMRYYNGIVFKGFINGIPTGILSGGQYDKMMKKLGRSSGAIGFAVYLDLLEQLQKNEAYDVDTVLLYESGTDPAAVAKAVRRLAESGTVTALTQIPDLKYQRIVSLKEVADLG